MLVGASAPGNEAVAAMEPVRVDLRAEALVTGERYRLCDIAAVHTSDKTLEHSLCALEIGLPPRVGYSEVVTRAQVKGRVERVYPVLRDNAQWFGAETTSIRIESQVVPVSDYQQVAEEFLRRWLAARYADFSIELRDQLADLHVPRGEVRVTARFAGGQGLSGRMGVLIDAKIGGKVYRTVPVWFAVQAYQDVLVPKQELLPSTQLQSSMFELRRVDVTTVKGAALTEATEISEMRLRERLEPGQAVPLSALEPAPHVQRGREVAVTSQVRNVAVVVMATALDDGRVGERVRVRRGKQGETFAVRVTGRARATVEWEGI